LNIAYFLQAKAKTPGALAPMAFNSDRPQPRTVRAGLSVAQTCVARSGANATANEGAGRNIVFRSRAKCRTTCNASARTVRVDATTLHAARKGRNNDHSGQKPEFELLVAPPPIKYLVRATTQMCANT
jgi:hypothetical protein